MEVRSLSTFSLKGVSESDHRSNEELTLKRLLCNSLRGLRYNLKSTADKTDVATKPGFCESDNG